MLCAVAEALVTQPAMRRLLRLGGGCLIILVLLHPLLSVDYQDVRRALEAFDLPRMQTQQETADNRTLLAGLVQEQTEAAIIDRAEQLGLALEVQVEVQWEDTVCSPVPWAVTLCGRADRDLQGQLQAFLEQELGIPPQRQKWVVQ